MSNENQGAAMTDEQRATVQALVELARSMGKHFTFTAERAGEVAALLNRVDDLLAAAPRPAQPDSYDRDDVFAEPLATPAAQTAASEVTPEMVAAYLKANDAYWKRTDELPPNNPSRWRQGTPAEATAESLRAALAASPAAPGGLTQTAMERYTACMTEGEEQSPLERLRFFCSLAMNGQDWLDVEPFFAALASPSEAPAAPMNCREAGPGKGLCDQCAQGLYERCRYLFSRAEWERRFGSEAPAATPKETS